MAMKSMDHGSCLVCGARAIGINFAVPTCAPCKAFFRRNAVKLGVSRSFCLLNEEFLFDFSRQLILFVGEMVTVNWDMNLVGFAIVVD